MITLHFCSNSRAQRVLWLLEELQLSYKLNKIKFHPSELKSEEHRKRHPLGRVPVLEDNDVTIYESGAIIEYIIAKYDDKGFKNLTLKISFFQIIYNGTITAKVW